jgi:erythromycin esterase-like protein
MGQRSAIEDCIRSTLVALDGREREHDALLDAIGDARFVLIGEPTHGSREVYRDRARITHRLIEERGFDAVAVEADWPDALRVNDYVKRRGADRDADAALAGFAGRFPTWMWRNREVLAFVERLRASRRNAGFYGLDLYSLYASIDHVLRYLDTIDAQAAAAARERYACFGHFDEDTSRYALHAGRGLGEDCEREATAQLVEMRERVVAARAAGRDDDALFYAEQNARLVKNAEEYYRNMFAGSVATWNLRDRHMIDTLGALVQHLDHQLGRPCKIVLWAHNSHLGDARATEMGGFGELNVGQLARERYGRDAFLVGYTTYDGTVTAAPAWDRPPEVKRIRPAIDGSFEALFHAAGVSRFTLLPDASGRLPSELRHERLERAIGVVYRPDTERASHWFGARLADQFDAVIHLDRTSAVEPLEIGPGWKGGEAPETFPFAL